MNWEVVCNTRLLDSMRLPPAPAGDRLLLVTAEEQPFKGHGQDSRCNHAKDKTYFEHGITSCKSLNTLWNPCASTGSVGWSLYLYVNTRRPFGP